MNITHKKRLAPVVQYASIIILFILTMHFASESSRYEKAFNNMVMSNYHMVEAVDHAMTDNFSEGAKSINKARHYMEEAGELVD